MGLFNRLFKVGESEAHSLVDKLENPIKMTEQGIRDLKKDLGKSLESLAEIKSMAIRSRQEVNQHKKQSANYEKNAMLLLQKAEKGELDAGEADRLAGEALIKKDENTNSAATAQENLIKFETHIRQLDGKIKQIKSTVSHYENELKTLKARAQVSKATKKINKSLSNIDSSGTVAMLEKMKDKVAKEEALAEAYGDIADTDKSIDDEINKVLNGSDARTSDSLAALKSKMKIKS